jgi:osmotically inducible protein OsmC
MGNFAHCSSKSMKRKATAIWNGTGREGTGNLTTQSGALQKLPYSFKARTVEDGMLGTNPEELIGAAHAGCFAMALSFQLAGANFPADELNVDAIVHMRTEGGIKIEKIDLVLLAKVPGISEELFLDLAGKAKAGCPVSQLFNCEITLDAKLV